MKTQTKIICLLLPLIFSMTSCYRGESKTLAGVLESAKVAYDKVSKPQPQNPEVSDAISKTLAAMEALLLGESDNQSAQMRQVLDSLHVLIPHANYTVRPAMTELSKQYQLLSERAKGADLSDSAVANKIVVDKENAKERGESTVALLVARTYRLLASELETSRFNIDS